jgi:hypothetical protein
MEWTTAERALVEALITVREKAHELVRRGLQENFKRPDLVSVHEHHVRVLREALAACDAAGAAYFGELAQASAPDPNASPPAAPVAAAPARTAAWEANDRLLAELAALDAWGARDVPAEPPVPVPIEPPVPVPIPAPAIDPARPPRLEVTAIPATSGPFSPVVQRPPPPPSRTPFARLEPRAPAPRAPTGEPAAAAPIAGSAPGAPCVACGAAAAERLVLPDGRRRAYCEAHLTGIAAAAAAQGVAVQVEPNAS